MPLLLWVPIVIFPHPLNADSSAPTPWIFHSAPEHNDDDGLPTGNASKMATMRNHSGSGFAEFNLAPRSPSNVRPTALLKWPDLYLPVKTAIRRSLLPSPPLLPAPTPCTAPPSHIFILRTTMPLPPPIAHSPATTRRRAPPRSIARRQTVNKLRARVGVRGRHTYLAPLRDHFYHDGDWPAGHALLSISQFGTRIASTNTVFWARQSHDLRDRRRVGISPAAEYSCGRMYYASRSGQSDARGGARGGDGGSKEEDDGHILSRSASSNGGIDGGATRRCRTVVCMHLARAPSSCWSGARVSKSTSSPLENVNEILGKNQSLAIRRAADASEARPGRSGLS
ncbi:hypothetical protein B0H11DRAFT_2257760 [Mycena galericulata]|nr:hypothetical protein B0H11DRAFT_2257760 [Mycena galericulata]